MFARSFLKAFPMIPIEDEGRLHDPKIRETSRKTEQNGGQLDCRKIRFFASRSEPLKMQISVAKGVEKTPKNSVTLDPLNARTGRGTLKKTFETGKLKIETLEEGKAWAKRIMDVKPFYSNYNRRAFIQAMIRVFHDSSYNNICNNEFTKFRKIIKKHDCSSIL